MEDTTIVSKQNDRFFLFFILFKFILRIMYILMCVGTVKNIKTNGKLEQKTIWPNRFGHFGCVFCFHFCISQNLFDAIAMRLGTYCCCCCYCITLMSLSRAHIHSQTFSPSAKCPMVHHGRHTDESSTSIFGDSGGVWIWFSMCCGIRIFCVCGFWNCCTVDMNGGTGGICGGGDID